MYQVLFGVFEHFFKFSIFEMRVTGSYNAPLDRQIMESVQISNFPGPVLMNRRNEMGGVRVERMQHRRVWWGGN